MMMNSNTEDPRSDRPRRRRAGVATLLAAVLVAVTGAAVAQHEAPGHPASPPRVLLIGDSICGGYFKTVQRELEGRAEVVKNDGNAEYTGTGVKKLDAWLGSGKWDVIHFNWGLWDMYGWEYAKENRSPAAYQQRLETIVARLKTTGARLIWATTTPACPGLEGTMLKRFNTELRITPEVERQYLDAALAVMKKHDVRINDLHALIKSRWAKNPPAPDHDDVHFDGATNNALGKQVAAAILKALGKTDPSVGKMQEDFLKLKFGMFIHFNMETYKGVQWVEGYHSPGDFNPGGKIDTDAWADAAKAAGMKYAVLTAKHVSGFCLWDSQYTTYDVMNPACAYQQDLVAQFVKSFTSRGLKVGLYYCWRHPGFAAKFKVLPPECDPATHPIAEQIEFQKKQIAELIERYPEVFYIWNDGLDPEIMPADEACAFFRNLRPGLLASGNWWDWGKKGQPYLDVVVSETRHLGKRHLELKTTGETCWCLENSWFHDGSGPKTAAAISTHLATANKNNANFLLNVGPDKHGRFQDPSIKVLAEIGQTPAAQP